MLCRTLPYFSRIQRILSNRNEGMLMIHKAYGYVTYEQAGAHFLLTLPNGLVPNGHVNDDEEWAQTVLRAVEEQTGLQATIQRFLTSDYGTYGGEAVHRHFYLLTVDLSQVELATGRWVTGEEMDALAPDISRYAYLAFT